MEPSIEDARAYFANRKWDGYVFADLTRYHTCCRIEEMAMPEGVKFTRLQNNGMKFECNNCEARIWKADIDGELQGPGQSKSKQAYFDQGVLFSMEPSAFRFAIVWEHDAHTGLLKLSIACPKQFDETRPWSNPECHFYLPFPHAATEIPSADKFGEVVRPENDIELMPKRQVQGGIPGSDV